MRRYITTAIDYPNAPPHMGHVLEKVLADALARWWRLNGDNVRFQVGTDEHGVKIQRTAAREKLSPHVLVDRNVPLFRDLYDRLCISYDRFVRTTDQEAHWPTVRGLWKRLQEEGALEKRTYRGLYCSGCERFVTKKDLVGGVCPDHGRGPEEVSEENWFFLLRREQEWLHDLLTRKDGYRIIPASRAHETISLLDQGLEDVSFSRPVSSLSWGIPVPGDEGQTMYVWCDALTNYISGLGYFTDHEEREWWDDADVTHVIGKDIARFHALIWPAMLKHAGIRPPARLLIHGFLTSEGQKMSKSIGNVVEPNEVIEKYGVDALRFYLCFVIPMGQDGDFAWSHFDEIYNGVLRDSLGNLLNRVLTLIKKDGGDRTCELGKDICDVVQRWKGYDDSMKNFEIEKALYNVNGLLSAKRGSALGLNKLISGKEPWKMSKDDRQEILWQLAEGLRHVALMLLPFIPQTAQKISKQLNIPYADRMLDKDFVIGDFKEWGGCKDWKRVGEPKILFPKVD